MHRTNFLRHFGYRLPPLPSLCSIHPSHAHFQSKNAKSPKREARPETATVFSPAEAEEEAAAGALEAALVAGAEEVAPPEAEALVLVVVVPLVEVELAAKAMAACWNCA